MKGSNKQFAMYLDSEYNDYSLEAHIKEKEKHDPEAKIKSAIQATTKPLPENSNTTSNLNNSPPKAFQQAPDMTPLTDDIIKEFLALLNDEALTWFEQLEAIERVGTEVLEAFKELYTKFQTVPVLFLSNVFDKGIYLWQVNRLCPYRKESNHMILDSKGLKGETKPNISILMLAKIVVEEDERIISAGIAGGNQICVRSRVREEEEVVRCYRIKDFAEIARINPYKQYILGNDRYSYKLVFKKANIEENGKHRVEVSLWKKKTGEEIQKEIAAVSKEEQEGEVKPILKDKLIQADTSLDLHITAIQNGFKEFGGTKNDVGFLFDKGYTSLVTWREDILLVKSFNDDQTMEWKVEENTMVIKLRNNKLYYQILFEVFPYLEFSVNHKIEYNYFSQFNGPSCPLRLRKPILATDPMRYIDKENLVYDVPLSVINPYFVEEDNKQEKGEEEKQEEVSKKSMEKIKGELRQIKNERGDIKVDLKSTKGLMKEVRADISEKMKEIKNYEDEYKENEKKKGKNKEEKLKEPESVSKETIELYKEIKAEKKKMEKEREKEKNRKKNDRSNNKEY